MECDTTQCGTFYHTVVLFLNHLVLPHFVVPFSPNTLLWKPAMEYSGMCYNVFSQKLNFGINCAGLLSAPDRRNISGTLSAHVESASFSGTLDNIYFSSNEKA